MLSERRHDRAPDHYGGHHRPLDREYPKWRTDATRWLQFRANFAGRYIEMRQRFQNGYGVVVWTGENDKCGRKSF